MHTITIKVSFYFHYFVSVSSLKAYLLISQLFVLTKLHEIKSTKNDLFLQKLNMLFTSRVFAKKKINCNLHAVLMSPKLYARTFTDPDSLIRVKSLCMSTNVMLIYRWQPNSNYSFQWQFNLVFVQNWNKWQKWLFTFQINFNLCERCGKSVLCINMFFLLFFLKRKKSKMTCSTFKLPKSCPIGDKWYRFNVFL